MKLLAIDLLFAPPSFIWKVRHTT